MAAQYTQGHDQTRLKAHAWRTAEKCAKYLLPHIRPGMSVLDIGCGPGSITVDFAQLVGPGGRVVGVEISEEPLKMAREIAENRGLTNITYQVGDIHKLDFADDTFDIVHVHQVLIHAGDPVHALQEMRRVTKKGGIVAAREGDFRLMAWYPEDKDLLIAHERNESAIKEGGGDPYAGRKLHHWAFQAGFDWSSQTVSVGSYLYHTREDREFIGLSSASRLEHAATTSKYAGTPVAEDLIKGAAAFRAWCELDEAWHTVTNGEIICRK